jgi:hypothetical protein
MEAALIQVDFITAHVRGKNNIRKPIIIQVPNGYTAAIIKIPEEKAIVQFSIYYFIIEVDAGLVH